MQLHDYTQSQLHRDNVSLRQYIDILEGRIDDLKQNANFGLEVRPRPWSRPINRQIQRILSGIEVVNAHRS
jgi:hypothetical protein